jgi:hypothetical protein
LKNSNFYYFFSIKSYDKYTIQNLITNKRKQSNKHDLNEQQQQQDEENIDLDFKESINFETLKPDNIYETLLFNKKDQQQEQDKTKRIKQLFNYYPQDSINDDEFNRNVFDPPIKLFIHTREEFYKLR